MSLGTRGDQPPAVAAGAAVTSSVVRQVARQFQSGRHTVVTEPGVVLLRGEAMPMVAALERIGRSGFDVVVHVNAVDDVSVVHGNPALLDDAPDIVDIGLPDRERRAADARRGPRVGRRDPTTVVRRLMAQDRHSVLVIVDQADIILQDPSQHDHVDRERVATLQLALRDTARVGRFANTCVLLSSSPAGVPREVTDGCENVTVIPVGCPDRVERTTFIETVVHRMDGVAGMAHQERAQLVEHLAQLTDGDTLADIAALVEFASASRLPTADLRGLLHRFRVGDVPDHWSHLARGLGQMRSRLGGRVFGQPAAVRAVMGVLASAALGLDLRGNALGLEQQPRGVLLFVGPTGVGKTELAKEVADAVFGDPEQYTRIDMSALSQPHTVATLLGSPPGYVGYGRPGLLGGVRERPSQVILFDEIEKAHPSVWTILMSILDDGRLVDAEGNALYFGDTIIVFTSNIGAAELMQLIASRGDDVSFDEIRDLTDNAVAQYFTELGMPEVYGRLEPGVVAFDILRPDALDQVATRLARAATFANGPDLHIDEASLCAMIRQRMADPTARALGGRQVRNVITAQLRELSVWLAEVGLSGAGRCVVSFDAGGMLADVDGAGPERVTDDLSVTNRDDDGQEGV